MAPISNLFVPYEPCAICKKVQILDGTLLIVGGIGSLKVDPKGLLTLVLHVELFISLVSVHRLAKLDEFKIIFDGIHGFLGNKVHGWRTRLSRTQKGLYYLSFTTTNHCKESDS